MRCHEKKSEAILTKTEDCLVESLINILFSNNKNAGKK